MTPSGLNMPSTLALSGRRDNKGQTSGPELTLIRHSVIEYLDDEESIHS